MLPQSLEIVDKVFRDAYKNATLRAYFILKVSISVGVRPGSFQGPSHSHPGKKFHQSNRSIV